jgi:hypothetical protein
VPAFKPEALVQIPVPPKKKKEAKVFPSTIIKEKRKEKVLGFCMQV